MTNKFIILFLLLSSHFAFAQQNLTGHVYESINGKQVSMPGATVQSLDEAVSTITDASGYFSISISTTSKVITSFTGFINDTSDLKPGTENKIYLKKAVSLSEVQISAHRQDLVLSTIKTANLETISSHELLKAACCNLSEAFETNPSVNVAYKDAVTGVKEIQLLGLGGTHVQMLSENIPDMRGLSGIYGLTFVPGPWIESIQLTKGSGSVVNGYESTTGQINVEFKKAFDKDQPRFYLNLFSDERGGIEANSIIKRKFSPYWSSMLMVHGRFMQNETDRNKDGFMDVPNNKIINLYNRWNYHNTEKLEAQINLKFLADEVEGGQVSTLNVSRLYKTAVSTRRAEISGKLGLLFPEKLFKSVGNIFQVTYHDMNSSFGDKIYNAKETSVYLQSIYQNVLWKTNHQYKTGLTYRLNILEQDYPGLAARTEENIPGAFFEYTYNYIDKLTLIAGVREDLQLNNQWVFTPRLHGKYNFTENTIFRFTAGKSYRRPYIIADHISVLASSRQTDIVENILAERAWNYGVNFTSRFEITGHELTFSADAYRTDFINQLVVDAYSDSTKILFYNLEGKSYSNSIQFTLNAELTEKFNFRVAYKIDDVRSTFNGKVEELPLISRQRALSTLSYSTDNEHWKFDYTFVWEGRKKLQFVYSDVSASAKSYSPTFFLMNFQATKVFKRLEVYAGAENILDYRQKDPIINPENPFGNSFDATNIWGPIEGRRIYAGLRFTIR